MSVTVLKWKPRGPVRFGKRDETVTPARPTVFGAEDCVDKLDLALQTQFSQHFAKCSAIDALDAQDIKSLSADGTMTLSNYTPANLLIGLNASSTAAEGSATAVTNEVAPSGIVNGDTIAVGVATPHFNLTAVTVVDSNATPATLVLGTDYTVDAANGMITIVNIGSYTQPFKFNYSHKDPQILAALTQGQLIRWIRFNGFNVPNASKAVNVDMFKAQFAPTSAFDLLPDDYGLMELKFTLLQDQSRSSSDPRGQYFSTAIA
jgi:hypothetical protein